MKRSNFIKGLIGLPLLANPILHEATKPISVSQEDIEKRLLETWYEQIAKDYKHFVFYGDYKGEHTEGIAKQLIQEYE